jgi:hypothetical protein
MVFKHDICQRIFDTQEDLDNHAAFDWTFSGEDAVHYVNPPSPECRVNEGSLLIKGFNY